MFLIILIGVIYLLIGCISLFTTLMFLELGRPKDLIQSGVSILLGTFLIIYKNIFTLKFSLIIFLNAVLINFYVVENFSYRWNQLLDKEKLDIVSLSGLKKNFSIIFKIISDGFKNIFINNKIENISQHTSIKKKWVRQNDNNNGNATNEEESSKNNQMKNIQTADFSKKDIISDEKINIENPKIDK